VTWNVWANLVGALVLVVLGLLAVLRGWLFPWLDRQVFRPRMAGASMLCMAVSLAIGGLALSSGLRWRLGPLFGLPFLLAGSMLALLSKAPSRSEWLRSEAGDLGGVPRS
jgi:hypothetical protein